MNSYGGPVTAEPMPEWVSKQHGMLWRNGTSEVVSCQCKTQPEPCAHMPTQEDLLCDHCRGECALSRSAGGSAHLDVTQTVDCTARMQAVLDAGYCASPDGAIWMPDLVPGAHLIGTSR